MACFYSAALAWNRTAVDIARTFPFDAVSDAYRAQAQGANFGKIVISLIPPPPALDGILS